MKVSANQSLPPLDNVVNLPNQSDLGGLINTTSFLDNYQDIGFIFLFLDIAGLICAALAVFLVARVLREPRMRFLFCASFCAAMSSLSILVVESSVLPGQSITAFELYRLFAQVCCIMIYLFVQDYTRRPISFLKSALLLFWGVANILLILPFPEHYLVFSDISREVTYLPYVSIENGPLSLVLFAITYILLILGVIDYVKYITVAKQDKIFVPLFLLMLLLGISSQIIYFSNILPLYWSTTPLTLGVELLLLVLYVITWRVPEWDTLGRYAAVQEMHDAFIIIDNNYYLVDMNTQAQSFFPALANVKVGRLLQQVKGFPFEVMDSRVKHLSYQLPPYGQSRHYLLTHSPLLMNSRRVGTCILIHDDTDSVVTAENRTHERLESNTTKLINASPFICLIFDERFNIIDSNPAALHFFGYLDKQTLRSQLSELVNHNFFEIGSEAEDNRSFHRHLLEARSSGRSEFITYYQSADEAAKSQEKKVLKVWLRSIVLENDPCIAAYITEVKIEDSKD